MIITKKQFLNSCKDSSSGQRLLKCVSHLIPLKGNVELAKLVSYLTFDGHLSKDLKQIYLSSKDDNFLRSFSDLIKIHFKFCGKYEICREGFGISKKYRVFSRAFSQLLLLAGTPSGNKSVTKFLVPEWIIANNDFSTAYLQIAFDSEGSIWKDRSDAWRIRFKLHKNEKLLKNGKSFMEQLRSMLADLDIETTNLWTVDALENRHGPTKGMVFAIKPRSFETFLNNINFRINEKRNRLGVLFGVQDVGQAK